MSYNIHWQTVDYKMDVLSLPEIQDQNIDEYDLYEDESEMKPNPGSLFMMPPSPTYYNSILCPYNDCNLFLLKTNMDLSIISNKISIIQKIASIPGVEIVRLITRYKALIGMSTIFNHVFVRAEIESQLTGKNSGYVSISKIENNELREKALKEYSSLTKKKNWAMYIFPNGQIISHSEEIVSEEFMQKLNDYSLLQKESNGIVVCQTEQQQMK